jgi:hypothetical protein
MAFYDKYIPKELKNPIDDVLDFGTDTFKKTGRAVRKLTPKELRPALPFLSAAVPFLLPGNFAMMGMNPLFSRGIMSALANATSQEALDPEGDINYLSSALAGITGALGADGVAQGARSGIETGIPAEAAMARGPAELGMTTRGPGFFQGAENIGREGIAQAADFVSGAGDTFSKFGKDPGALFEAGKKGARFPGLKELGIASAIPVTQGSGDLAYAIASKAQRDFEAAELEELRQAGLGIEEIQTRRAAAIRAGLEDNNYSEEEIAVIFERLGLTDFLNVEAQAPYQETAANGGIIGLKEGGMLDFGGKEMDLRGGGFVPMGKKERADDVPARLSKNEFVMTADAVRAAGGGSVNKGAQRMYDIMNRLEARA